jgi:hypothetical protein
MGRKIRSEKWERVSIPKEMSTDFNADMLECTGHFSDDIK